MRRETEQLELVSEQVVCDRVSAILTETIECPHSTAYRINVVKKTQKVHDLVNQKHMPCLEGERGVMVNDQRH